MLKHFQKIVLISTLDLALLTALAICICSAPPSQLWSVICAAITISFPLAAAQLRVFSRRRNVRGLVNQMGMS